MSRTTKKADGAGADASAPRRGRPRSETADAAILEATLHLLAEQGLERMSMDAVAERSGVSKATIYRRWASKTDLAVDSIVHLRPQGPIPDTGSLVGDMAALAAAQVERLGRGDTPGIVPRMLAESIGDPELHQLLMDRGVRPVRALLGELVERAVKRGELPEDTDVELVVDVIHGSAVYRLLIDRGDPAALARHMPRLARLLTR